ncbi:alginate lyase family protein [uncultured Draconibacterium sp.]|uniref:alginate lyase family protein n=1 Tax=uncultured Draconibacterium sp. TaxID=1573823 RepID=UPI002AA6F0DF|nr:alginate lyase family protein [uncultured Draconibacterium sp.]
MWIINRLRAMSVFEVVFRIKQFAQKYYEKFFVVGQQTKVPSVKFNSLPVNLNGLTAFESRGVIHVFGKEFAYNTPEIDWHTDIFSNQSFSKQFSKSINIRAHNDLSAKVVWEINRMQFLTIIALNYKKFGHIKDIKLFIGIIESWIQQNPYLKGINWYSNIEINIRLIVWYFCWNILNAEALIQKHDFFKDFVEKKWLPCIYQHCKYSYHNPSKYSSSNNHLISEYSGLFIASTLWQFPESKKWNCYAKEGLEKEIVRQHSLNGVNKEEAAEYIQFITDFFMLPYVVARKNNTPFSKKYEGALKSILFYINNLLDTNGNFPKYGDEDDGKCILFTEDHTFNNFQSLLNTGAILFNEPAFRTTGNDLKTIVLTEVGKPTHLNKLDASAGVIPSKFYKKEGHGIFRFQAKGEEIYVHFNAAPLGFLSIAAHGHADALSFILHINGNPFFVDPGTYTYHTEYDWRKYFVGTLAHNTIRVNQTDQAKLAGPTLWLNHYKCAILKLEMSEDSDTVIAQHNGYEKFGITHTREFCVEKNKNRICITDTVECKKNGEYFIELPFHLHPDIYVNKLNDSAFQCIDKELHTVHLQLDKKLKTSNIRGQKYPQILGWYSKSFMQKEPGNTIYCTTKITHTQKFQSIISLK